ncbi:MAG: hypothetical protein F4213_02420 [Boseongicola sp. SB0677_bin_26]|nr:hypothetical protein [Boseongicola sp. SB0677_bin_26]
MPVRRSIIAGTVSGAEGTDCPQMTTIRSDAFASCLPTDWRGTGLPDGEKPAERYVESTLGVDPGRTRTFNH